MDPRRDAILSEARARLGIPYALPPDGVNTLDCSLYVLKVYEAAGVPLPVGVRTAEQERQATVPIDWPDVLPGDLLFYEKTYDATEAPGPDGLLATHVGISLGAGTHRMMSAVEPASKESRIDTDYWQSHLLSAGRAPQLETPVVVNALPLGIDVSSNNGAIDWPAVAGSGVEFAFIKVTEDSGYLNPNFEHDWPMARRVGLIRGAYHFARPEGADAVEEADWFLDQIDAHGGLETGDLLALDLESGAGDLGPWALDFLHRCEERAGFKPLVYTAQWFSGPHGLPLHSALADYGLWQAAYQDEMPAPIAPWNLIAVWQSSDAGSIPGIRGDVDLDSFNGTIDRLPLYGKPGSVQPPQPPNPSDTIRAQLAAIRAACDAAEAALT